jgi:hypothetical protein
MCQIGSVRQIVAMLRKRNAYFGTTFFQSQIAIGLQERQHSRALHCNAFDLPCDPREPRVWLRSCHCLARAPTHPNVETNDERAHLHCVINADRQPRR